MAVVVKFTKEDVYYMMDNPQKFADMLNDLVLRLQNLESHDSVTAQ